KTDGAAVAGGGITESLILAKSAAEGVTYQPGWILGTTATVKVFIDIFIGIWAFVLGYIWTNHINVTSDKAKIAEIWQRFPKFILGFVVTFVVGLYLALGTPADIASKVPTAIGEANTFRVIFFILTFFSIGVLSNFKKLWQEGIGKLAAVYVISLFGFVIWVGLIISWLFFSGIQPPLAGLSFRGALPWRNLIFARNLNELRPSRCCRSRRSSSALAWEAGSSCWPCSRCSTISCRRPFEGQARGACRARRAVSPRPGQLSPRTRRHS